MDSFTRNHDNETSSQHDTRNERSSTVDNIQLSMIAPLNTTNNIEPDSVTYNRRYFEESTFVRTDSIKSSSLLKLTDIITQNILIHPFMTLRRTCQVNRKCSPFICVQPFSLMSFMYHQQRKQGTSSLYKGLSSELLVKGMTLGTVTALANYADWPTEVNSKRYFEDSIKVAILRGLSVAITTPFLCSSVIETVQSVIVVKDRPAFIDCLKEGFFRLLQVRWSPSSRILPIWLLVVPTVFYHVAHSAIKNVAENLVDFLKSSMSNSYPSQSNSRRTRYQTPTRNYSRQNNDVETMTNQGGNDTNIWSRNQRQSHPTTNMFEDQQHSSTLNISNVEPTNSINFDANKISTSIFASLIADVALLPVETILNRLYIQGTRTIIDNCDETTVVLPVLTNYEGFSDCYQSILRFEGQLGLVKGLGAIVLQYGLHYILFRSLYFLLREFQLNVAGDSDDQHRPVSNLNNRVRLDPSSKRSYYANTGSKLTNNQYSRQIYQENTFQSTPNNIAASGTTINRRTVDNSDDNYRLHSQSPATPYNRIR